MNETFGQRFSRIRKNLWFTQEDIALKVNISPQAVSKWENDLSAPDISLLPLLADIFNVSLDELLGRKVEQTILLPKEERKDINSMLLRINVVSGEGDKVTVNLPLTLIKVCLEAEMDLPNISGKDFLKNIDLNQIFMLIDAGVMGKLVEIESADGDKVSITAE